MHAGLALDMAVAIGRRGPVYQRLRDGLHALVRGRNLVLAPTVSPGLTRERLAAIARSVDRESSEAYFDHVSGALIEGSNGLFLNVEASFQQIMRAVSKGQFEVNLVVQETVPRIAAADLKSLGTDIIARFETPITIKDPNRLVNIKLAAKALNGAVVKPGQVFSFNGTTGPREPQFGYLEAKEIYRGQFVLGYGGGVCQVSSTLYNAALLANLEIVERYHHSRPLSYVPLGRDATVAYGRLDLKFRNSTPNPVLITAGVIGDSSIRVQILGVRTPGVQVAVVTRGEKSFKAPVEEVLSPELRFGRRVVEDPGIPGYEVSVFRVIKSGGDRREELISRDRYPAQPGKTVVGIGRPLEGDFFYLFGGDE
jgi:vancomycin resistance protein YoaR